MRFVSGNEKYWKCVAKSGDDRNDHFYRQPEQEDYFSYHYIKEKKSEY